MFKKIRSIEDRFTKFIAYEPSVGCWLWLGPIINGGYGTFTIGRNVKPRQVLSHRFSYELYKGVIPEGLDLDHLCRNRCCCNPDHLEPVTRKGNIRRGIKRSDATHCKYGHLFIGDNLFINKIGGRICIECRRRNNRASKKRRKIMLQRKEIL